MDGFHGTDTPGLGCWYVCDWWVLDEASVCICVREEWGKEE